MPVDELEQQPAIAFVVKRLRARATASPRSRSPCVDLRERVERGAPRGRDHGAAKRAPGDQRLARPSRRARSCTRLPSSWRSSELDRGAAAAGDVQAVDRRGLRRSCRAPPCRRSSVDSRERWRMYRVSAEERERVRPGPQAADQVVDVRRRPRPVDEPFGLRQLRRVGDAALRPAAFRARCRPRSHRASRRAARRRESPASIRRSVVVSSGPIGTSRGRQHRSGIERLDDPHDRDAGFAIAGDHRAMNRRGAAIARQQRRVHVDQADARRRQQPVRQDLAVGGHHADVGVERREVASANASRDSRSGCSTGRPAATRQRLDRAVGDLLSAAARAIGLRDDAGHRDGASASRCSSVGTAKPGVPKNATRSAISRFTTCRLSRAS